MNQTKGLRVYVAGPMTGRPEWNYPAFRAATRVLEESGHVAVDPSRFGIVPRYDWADYMRAGLTDLLTCDRVHLLPGWETSRGALIEARLARDLGIASVGPRGEELGAVVVPEGLPEPAPVVAPRPRAFSREESLTRRLVPTEK